MVDPGPGDRAGGAAERQRLGRGQSALPLARSGFSDFTSDGFEFVAAGVGGDLAYTVGYEHTSVSWDGVPMEPYILRVTHAYRREDGEWKTVRRHADAPDPSDFPS